MGFMLSNWLEKRIDLADIEGARSIIGDIQERLATKRLAFYIASSYLSETLSKCEIKHYVNGKETKDKWYYLFNISPNTNQNAFELKSKFITKLVYEGEALMFMHKDQLYVADSFNKEEYPISGDVFKNISLLNEAMTFERKADDVFYINLGENNKIKPLIDSMLDDYTEILNHAFDIYKSNNAEKYKMILDGIKTGDKSFNDLFNEMIKSQLDNFLNNRKAVFVENKGYKLEELGTHDGKTDSSDIRNLRKEIFETTAEAFKMPVSMLYGNMTNVKDVIASWVSFGVDPKAKIIGEELTRKTGTVEDYLNGTYFDVDTTCILHRDIFDIADPINKLISSGLYNIDAVLHKLGEQPLNTDFSKQHWITKNYDKIENLMNGVSDTEGGE